MTEAEILGLIHRVTGIRHKRTPIIIQLLINIAAFVSFFIV
ncbi:TPA: hypothetical protein ACF5AQ_005052 [Escherichia coli]|nr:hypothetical protein [Escherichia coli]MDS1528435.1 hypothetical protein [Escherichia coli]